MPPAGAGSGAGCGAARAAGAEPGLLPGGDGAGVSGQRRRPAGRAARPGQQRPGAGNPRINRNPVLGPFFHAGYRNKSARNPLAMASVMAFSALFRRLHKAEWLIPVSAAICASGTPSSRFRPISAA